MHIYLLPILFHNNISKRKEPKKERVMLRLPPRREIPVAFGCGTQAKTLVSTQGMICCSSSVKIPTEGIFIVLC